MILRLFFALCAVAACAAPAAAQSDQSGSTPTTFRSGIELVRFDVRIVDEAGRPVTDIRPEEIEVHENGRTLPVVLFQRVTEPAESYVDAAMRAVTAEVSSNEAFPRGHLYVLIFDQQHITAGNEQRARMAAEQFIRRRVRPSDRVALFALPGPGPQMGFTSDRTKVAQALTAIRGAYDRNVTTAVGEMTIYEAHRLVQGDVRLIAAMTERLANEAGADLNAVNDPSITRRLLQENARTIVNQTDAMSRQFLQRLADVIAGFRDIEGRKTVVLFSEGFFQDNLSRELETVAAAAAQSYCVFYAFDLNQRANAQLGDADIAGTPAGSEIHARLAPMGTLAAETDGMLVVDAANRTGQALDTIAAQAQDYYLVGFTPSDEARANRGKYRRVTIKVKRPGAQVSARTGYAVGPESSSIDRRRAIDAVLGAPFVQQALKIDYTTYVMKAAEPGRHRVVLSLNADLPVRSNPKETADVVFVVRDVRDGHVVASGTDTIALPAAAREGAPLGTGTWRVQFNVPAGSYLMRTVVREPGGLVGSADRRIDVRPFDGPDVTVSDLVIGSALGGLPVRPRAYTANGLQGVIETYGRTLTQLQDVQAKIELRPQQEGAAVLSFAADLAEPEQDDNGGVRRRATFQVPLESATPGEYLVRVIVTARGEVVAERTRQIEVLAGAVPVAAAGGAQLADTVAPIEVTRGHLGQTYIATLRNQAQGTPAADAARRAAEGRWEEVELELRRLPDDMDFVAQALRGFALFVREDYAGAASALERAFNAQPKSAFTAFFLGWAHEGAGNSRAALSAWRSAAYLDPSLVSAHLALADGYLRLSQPALAVQAIKAGLTALPASPELLARLEQLQGR